MRQIFSSQRVETAEGVARLLRDADIEVRITNGRSYRSRRSGQFSYLEPVSSKNLPTVWVVKADDQVRAREILRDNRLLDTTRRDHPTAGFTFNDMPQRAEKPRNWGWRIRIGLLLVIAAVAFFILIGRNSSPPAPATVPAPQLEPAAAPAPEAEPEEIRVRIVPAS